MKYRQTYGQLTVTESDNWMVQDVMYELAQLAEKHGLRVIITHKNEQTYVGVALPSEQVLNEVYETGPDTVPTLQPTAR